MYIYYSLLAFPFIFLWFIFLLIFCLNYSHSSLTVGDLCFSSFHDYIYHLIHFFKHNYIIQSRDCRATVDGYWSYLLYGFIGSWYVLCICCDSGLVLRLGHNSLHNHQCNMLSILPLFFFKLYPCQPTILVAWHHIIWIIYCTCKKFKRCKQLGLGFNRWDWIW